jgi:hypothetical protein
MHADRHSLCSALAALSRDQIQRAGQRYTPGIDPDAPNLKVESLLAAIENIAAGPAALARFQLVLGELSNAWGRAANFCQQREAIRQRIDEVGAMAGPMLDRLRVRDVSVQQEWLKRLAELEVRLTEDISFWRSPKSQLEVNGSRADGFGESEVARSNMNAIGRCLGIVRKEIEFGQTSAFKVLCDPLLLIRGAWGTGKTHLACDYAQQRIKSGRATALVLAQSFSGDVVEEICARIQPTLTVEQVFDDLDELGRNASERTILIVDGVNEGRRREWKSAISRLQGLVADRPHVGLIVTCRSPFESLAITEASLEKFHAVEHIGFDEQEFDAQAAFFDFYKLPLPEVPLLDKEFSRPLTLKLICQSLQKLSAQKRAQGFAGISSGQKGMTYVLEHFINRVGKSIEDEFALKGKGCWTLLKGNDGIEDQRAAGFAPCMAANLRGYVGRSEAIRIIAANYPAMKPAKRKQLLDAMRTSGLLEEDAIWYSSKRGIKPRVVFRLPYQRFSDHLIARHLLSRYLDTSCPESIRQSFDRSFPLGRVFRVTNRHQRQYAEPGWAQALIAEFPRRVLKKLPSNQRELFFALPKRAQHLGAYFNPFVEGLFWRDPEAFSDATGLIINHYLNSGTDTWEAVVDALAAVSTKPAHPFHARRLYRFIASYSMPERDHRWSEYLRRRYASPTFHRLLSWASKLDSVTMSHESAAQLVILFSLVLTTVVRSDRDLATKALVLIGEKFPDTLFSHVIDTLEFNDPYVPERMLAAAFGVVMSLIDSEAAVTVRPQIGRLAEVLYEKMFAPGADRTTHHTLMRDSALGVIELAMRASCFAPPEEEMKLLKPPFPNVMSKFTSDGTPDPAVTAALGQAIQMDFGNYVIGGLIPNRANYDNKNPEYVRVRAKIEKRMFDLGYREELFDSVDQSIGRDSWRADDKSKVDRYGKKYSWIAFFEMWGEREASNGLPDWSSNERISECGVDPSFPKRPPEWVLPAIDFFGGPTESIGQWVAGGFTPNWCDLLVIPEINGHPGAWILLQGFVSQTDATYGREIFAFLRGLFLRHSDVAILERKFLDIDYPSYAVIPEGATEHYLFAGEAGRRQSYMRRLCRADGQYRRQTDTAFGGFESVVLNSSTSRPTQVSVDLSLGREGDESFLFRGFVERPGRLRRTRGVRIELPYVHFGWESHHSVHNDFFGFDLPSPSLIQRLDLASKNREIDFYDRRGKRATLYREGGLGWRGDRHHMLYVRADLLRRYLVETRQALVWCNWGERGWARTGQDHVMSQDPVRSEIFRENRHVHRSFSRWWAKDSTVI